MEKKGEKNASLAAESHGSGQSQTGGQDGSGEGGDWGGGGTDVVRHTVVKVVEGVVLESAQETVLARPVAHGVLPISSPRGEPATVRPWISTEV